ncbi:MAG: hypothetical protein EOO41_04885, partial [Methanobacteriota archaeon]
MEPTSGPVSLPPSAVWLTVFTYDAANYAAGNAFLADLWTVRLPQFSDDVNGQMPPLAAPTITNPAGEPAQAAACGWMTYWNGSSCALLPYMQVQSASSVLATSLKVRWRSLPQSVVVTLVQSGCQPWNVTCLRAWTTAQFANASFPASLPFSSSSSVGGGVVQHASPYAEVGARLAAQRWARMSATDRAATLKLHAQLTSGVFPNVTQADEFLAAMYGNRFLLFIAVNTNLLGVFDMPTQVCSDNAVQLQASLAATLPMLGPVRTLQPSANGQFVFGAVDRSKYFLSAMERSVEICNQLAVDPSDPFLQPYADSCAQTGEQSPRLPGISDFLQIASACLPGMSCPSFNDEVIAALPEGMYTSFNFDAAECEPGYICSNGIR